jgi:hypothetical protein
MPLAGIRDLLLNLQALLSRRSRVTAGVTAGVTAVVTVGAKPVAVPPGSLHCLRRVDLARLGKPARA